MAGERDFKTDAQGCARQGGRNWLATFVGLGVHASAFDFAQHTVRGHQPVHQTLRWVVAGAFFHLCDDVEVHTAREGAFLARCDDNAFDRVICEGLVDERIKVEEPLLVHHVHGLALSVPCDDGNAISVCGHYEICHFRLLSAFGRFIWWAD